MKAQPARWWDFPAVAILFLAILISAARLIITGLSPFLFFTQTMGVIGLILGVSLGNSKLSRSIVLTLATGFTFMIVPWQLSQAVSGGGLLINRLNSLAARLLLALSQFINNQLVNDSILFLSISTLGFWLIGLTAGYWLTRHANFLVAVLPAGIVLLIVQIYDQYYPSRIWFMAFYIFLSLLLLGRLNYLHNKASWDRMGLLQIPGTGRDIFKGLLIKTAIFTLLAWTLPISLSSVAKAVTYWERLTQPLQTLNEQLSRIFDPLESLYSSRTGDFFGSQMRLGQNAPVSEAVMFTVQIPSQEVPRYFWRGRVYNYYKDGIWTATNTLTQDFSPSEENITLPDAYSGRTTRLVFTTYMHRQTLLYLAARTIWVSQPGSIIFFEASEQSREPVGWRTSNPLTSGDQFIARMVFANPTIAELRSAGINYPDWVYLEYLQLPEDFSARIRDLAEQITAGAETPYDKVARITEYLRREIEYTTTIPIPPQDTDIIEWILFDLKAGFCDYYATAEVLMLRSLGIPARLVVGFSQGDFSSEEKIYTVLGRNAHAWPEVYFPGIGWVEFEPTGNQPAIELPLERQPILQPGTSTGEVGIPSDQDRNPHENRIEEQALDDNSSTQAEDGVKSLQLIKYLLLTFSSGAALALLFLVLERKYAIFKSIPVRIVESYTRSSLDAPTWIRRWAARVQLTAIEKSFATINWSLRRLKEPPKIHNTPAERARKLAQKLPEAAAAVDTLAAEYQSSIYTLRPGDARRAHQASQIIYRLTLRELLIRWWKSHRN